MISKHFLALFLWCHCYTLVLNPILQLATGFNLGHYSGSEGGGGDRGGGGGGGEGGEGEGFQSSIISSSLARSSLSSSHSFALPLVAATPITTETNQVALIPGVEILLRCNIAEYPDEQFTWSRVRHYPIKERDSNRERTEEELKQTDDKIVVNNNFIILKSPVMSDVGDYYCKVKNPRADIIEEKKMISVRAKPYIHEFDLESSTYKSAIVEEGKSLKLPCNVVDDYVQDSDIKITWHMSKFDESDMNEVISGEDGIKTEVINSTSQALIIDRITKDHRRFYKCQVTNGITDNNKVILIRVKDKLTVLWPTVGIIIELVILIGVIIIVENRKVEPDKDTYDRKAIQM